MKREHAWGWLRSVGRVVLSAAAGWGGVLYCLPPANAIEQWPAGPGTWTRQERLGKLDRRAWASFDALLREASSSEDGRPGG